MFFKFTNFYYQFIQIFNRIAVPLIPILKISSSTESTTQLEKGIVGVGGNSKARHDRNKPDRSEIDDGKIDGDEIDNKARKKGQKMSKSKNLIKSKKLSKSKKSLGSNFFIPEARLVFIKLRQAFIKAPILHHFDLKRHIRIKTDESNYAIGRVLNQLISDDLG